MMTSPRSSMPIRLFALGILVAGTTASAQPPPLGPPSVRTGQLDLAVSAVTAAVRAIAQEGVTDTNASLAREGKSERISLASITVGKLSRPATDQPNRPNSFVVRVPYELRFEVHIPNSFNRTFVLPLAIDISCDNWHTSAGTVVAFSHASPVALTKLPVVRLSPESFDTLVVIGQVEQPPHNALDSAFAVATRAEGYRPGQHTLQIPKWFTQPPPGQFDDKPRLIRIPAYELSYTVRFDQGVLHQ